MTLSIDYEFRRVPHSVLTFLRKWPQWYHLRITVETEQRTLISGEFRVPYKDMKFVAKFYILTNDHPPPPLILLKWCTNIRTQRIVLRNAETPHHAHTMSLCMLHIQSGITRNAVNHPPTREKLSLSAPIWANLGCTKLLVYWINGNKGGTPEESENK